MYRLVFASLLVVGLLFATSTAQEIKKAEPIPPPPTKDEPKKELPKVGVTPKGVQPLPGEVDINFLNGSTVRMLIQSDKLEVATLYGKLFVPVKDLRGIEFGLHYPEGVEAKIEAAMKNLGSSDYREREKASTSLTELGPFSYPAVLVASQGKDAETAPRAKEILKKLQANHPKKDLKTSADDRVITAAFTIVGRILTPTIKAKTEYFGEVELSLAKMRTLRSLTGGTAELDVAVDATKYANAGQWMETAFQVDGKTAIVITAKGIVDTWPQQPGAGVTGPNGIQFARNGGFPGGMMWPAGRKVGFVNANQHSGMLLGKIGESGEMFTIGERYEGTPETEGKIYLHIGPSQYNVQSSGNYDVKITRKSN